MRLLCEALPEYQFKPIIADNYYSQTHFRFELDHAQASKLMSMFSSLVVAPRPFIPQNPPKWTAVVQKFPSNIKREESGTPEPSPLTDNFASSCDSIGTSATSDDSLRLDEKNQLAEASLCNSIVESDEKNLIYMKLKELAFRSEFTDSNNIGHTVGASSTGDTDLEHETHDDDLATLGKNSGSSLDSLDFPAIIGQVLVTFRSLCLNPEFVICVSLPALKLL